MSDENVSFDRNFVALEDRLEVEHWMLTFGCSREQLIDAVRNVGNSVEAVRRHLGQ